MTKNARIEEPGKELATRLFFDERDWQIPADLTWDQYVATGERIGKATRWLMWRLGDWLNFGEKHFGGDYRQVAHRLGYAPKTLEIAQWLAARIPPEERNLDVTWYHHQKIATLPSQERRKWLARAAEEGLSARALAAAVRESRKERGVSIRKEQRATKEDDIVFSLVSDAQNAFFRAFHAATHERNEKNVFDSRVLLVAARGLRDRLGELIELLDDAP